MDEKSMLHFKLTHAVTDFDRKQQAKRGYNIFALSQYLGAVSRIEEEIQAGRPIRDAIVSNLNGRLLDRCLKAVGEPTSTIQEQRGF
jgi:hypothetical protein